MITCNLMGGLGNQIFQIFTTIAYAIKSKNKFEFLNLEKLGEGSTTIRPTYWNTFFSNLKPFLIKELPQPIHVIKEKEFPYNELPVNEMIKKNVLIYGYFQSYKYFDKYYELICRMLGLEKKKSELLTKIGFSKYLLKNSCSMHFRIGDYKKIQDFHPLLKYDFYEKSLQYICDKNPNEKYTIYYFCEEDDIEDVLEIVGPLTKAFPDYTFERGNKEIDDWEQLLLMSCCHHNIIANSSFSWWAAYLNTWEDKIVCYPSVWFGPSANIDTRDLCPLPPFPPLRKVEPKPPLEKVEPNWMKIHI